LGRSQPAETSDFWAQNGSQRAGNDDEDEMATPDDDLNGNDSGGGPIAAERPLSPHLAALSEKARDYARAARAENTQRAYDADWRHFASWLRRQGLDPLPPDPQTVGLYLAACMDEAPDRPPRGLVASRPQRGRQRRSSNENGLIAAVAARAALGWATLIRMFALSGMMKEGTFKSADAPAASQLSPIAIGSGGISLISSRERSPGRLISIRT
jgi:hypothetical protein